MESIADSKYLDMLSVINTNSSHFQTSYVSHFLGTSKYSLQAAQRQIAKASVSGEVATTMAFWDKETKRPLEALS